MVEVLPLRDIVYYSLKKKIIESYTSGDLDNSYNQINMSLFYLSKLYDADRFMSLAHNIETANQVPGEIEKLLTEIQDQVDLEFASKAFGELNK